MRDAPPGGSLPVVASASNAKIAGTRGRAGRKLAGR
jgi:hypothetical protein